MLADTVPDLPADPSAWSDGTGVRVCVVDTGVECGHPSVGTVQGSYEVTSASDGTLRVVESGPLADGAGDGCGHGTACAGIVRRVAPDCELYSVRVLGEGFTGTGEALLTGLRWAVDQGFDVVNLSLSTTRPKFLETLRALADQAFFTGTTLVASAHNTPVESFPGGSRPSSRSVRTARTTPGSSSTTRRPPSSSSHRARTCRWPGRAARPSAPRATASPPLHQRDVRTPARHAPEADSVPDQTRALPLRRERAHRRTRNPR